MKLYGCSRRFYDSEANELIFSKGNSCFVYDQKNNKYIDFISGYGPIILGHNNLNFLKRVFNRLNDGVCFPSYGELHFKYAQMINNYYSNHKVIGFLKTSSEAIQAATRVASYITKKKSFIRLGYIGWHDCLIKNNKNWHEPKNSLKRSESLKLNFLKEGNDDEKIFNWEDFKSETFEKIVLDNIHIVGCFVLDAYQLSNIDKKVIEEVIHICKENKILVILDETKTSGRSSPVGYFKDILEFDFTILGKAIANGFPLSVLIGKKGVDIEYDLLKFGGTFSKELSGPASAISLIEIMSENDGYLKIKEIGSKIVDTFNVVSLETGLFEFVRFKPSLNGRLFEIEYCYEIANNFEMRKELQKSFFKNGLLIMDGHCSFVCLEHRKILDVLKERFHKVLDKWQIENNEFFGAK
ncbi:MAG: aminotransferase class III-fold pyridoxal phosphate-dependent enzyme [Fusobacteriaceae bacterium]|nr:aminotransferase class III-fold pyridoxal phosphate-dependent enzyme [Fusobacteriaceae bacterium]